jgi:hypothetical protein
VAVVNYAPHQSQCYVRLPFADLEGREWRLQDQLGAETYDRGGADLEARGLFLDMRPWQACAFDDFNYAMNSLRETKLCVAGWLIREIRF